MGSPPEAQTGATWIWQQPDWPRFRWDQARLQPLLHQAREHLIKQLNALEAPAQEAMAALLGRESLGTAAIEGEQLLALAMHH